MCHNPFHASTHIQNQIHHTSYHFSFHFLHHIISHSINQLLICNLRPRCICNLWSGLYQNNNIFVIRIIDKEIITEKELLWKNQVFILSSSGPTTPQLSGISFKRVRLWRNMSPCLYHKVSGQDLLMGSREQTQIPQLHMSIVTKLLIKVNFKPKPDLISCTCARSIQVIYVLRIVITTKGVISLMKKS